MSLFGSPSINGHFGPAVNYFMADRAGGGGEPEDPHDYDDSLARQFKIAMRYQISHRSSTADPYGLSTLSQNILRRVEQVGRCLFLLSQELRPIAAEIVAIESPSDRENGDIVCYRVQKSGLKLDTP